MAARSVFSALFVLLFITAGISGCRNREDVFSPTAPESSAPSRDQRLVGVWYALESDGGYQLTSDGAVLALTVDQQNKLRVDAETDPGQWTVPEAGHCVFSWIYLTGPSQSQVNTGIATYLLTYVLTNHDSTLILTSDSSHEGGITYVRKALGDPIR